MHKIPYTYVGSAEQVLTMNDGFLAADELWTWCDSRISGSKKNKFVTLVLAKSRKRGIHIAYSTQYFKAVDIRVRTVTDMIAIPRLNSRETICTLNIYSNPGLTYLERFRFMTRPIWDLYDTTEEVKELDIQEILGNKDKKKKGDVMNE